MARTVYLVSCVSMKRPEAAEARDLYISDWFMKARRFVEGAGEPWFILSARHGLVSPYRVIEPYEQTLNDMSASERRRWAEAVLRELRAVLRPGDRVVFLAGARYRNDLVDPLRALGASIEIPMEGLPIGKQLAWLGSRGETSDGGSDRLALVERLYELLGELERQTGGTRTLADVRGRNGWPNRGVYFFFEPGEERSESGQGPRVVRVGTHAVSKGSRSSLWNRLSQHRGTGSGGGNHRGSIFRRWVGASLIEREGLSSATWGVGSSARAEVRREERGLEERVSSIIRSMPFLWIEVDDEPDKGSARGVIERGSIALLSNAATESPVDPPSKTWLGLSCPKSEIATSGLWNVNHVRETPDPAFLELLERHVDAMPER